MNATRSILIVEDDKSYRMLLEDAFLEAGFDVTLASSAEAGLQEATQEQPDFVLLDYTLPEHDGSWVLTKMRDKDSEWARQVPILILTQHSDISKVAETVKKGAQGYLIKSDVETDDIVAEVESRLQREDN